VRTSIFFLCTIEMKITYYNVVFLTLTWVSDLQGHLPDLPALLNQIPSPQGHEIQHPDRVEDDIKLVNSCVGVLLRFCSGICYLIE
jgi:hypothetical protein